ncbi:MAG: methylenetetrahydrofolate reductase [NAD(P)H] [Bacillota bacterium]|jgi:methylenetetrahydrofolate reductase (NADPH)|nr:methylenetetrahydrofolate reductase [NAD(P)H] [Bacillota bacterium]
MNIKDLFVKKKAVVSFEIFPPKATSPIEKIYDTLEALRGLMPDYISITYGAGGSVISNRTVELASLVKNKYKIEPLAHLTAIHSSKEDILHLLNELKEKNINNILALRGDIKEGHPVSKDFRYASDLVKFILQNGNFNISGACYPEGHFESANLDKDLDFLKKKVDSGVTHLNTQLFFDNQDFYCFLEKARKKGINVPIQAGIMPIVKKKQIENIVFLSGVKLPSKFSKLIAKYGHDDEMMRAAGVEYATEQIIDLLKNNVQGIHLYIMNNAQLAKDIIKNISHLLEGINRE